VELANKKFVCRVVPPTEETGLGGEIVRIGTEGYQEELYTRCFTKGPWMVSPRCDAGVQGAKSFQAGKELVG